jgi:hypothetical protein
MCAFVPCLLPVPVQMFFSEGVFVWMFRNDPVFVFQNEPCTTGSYHTTEALYHTMHIHDHPCTNLRLYPTLYTLWQYPHCSQMCFQMPDPETSPSLRHIMQEMTIHPPVPATYNRSQSVCQELDRRRANLRTELCWTPVVLAEKVSTYSHILYQICINMIQYVWIIMFTYISLYNII